MENASPSIRTLPPEERYDAYGVEEVHSKWFPDGFLNVLEDPEIYGYLRKKYAEVKYIEMLGMPRKFDEVQAPFNSLFVLPRLSETPIDPGTDEAKWAEQLIPLVRAMKEHSQLVILGDPGTGKTTIVSWLVNQLTVSGNSIPKEHLGWLVPFEVTLRKFDLPRSSTAQGWLHSITNSEAGSVVEFEKIYWMAKRGQLLLLLDGIDELSLSDRRTLQAGISKLLYNFPRVRLLATSRPLGYSEVPLTSGLVNKGLRQHPERIGVFSEIDNSTPASVFGGGSRSFSSFGVSENRNLGDSRDLPRFWVAPFQDEQVSNLVQRWYSSREPDAATANDSSTKLLTAIRAEQSLSTLARTPRLLTMMALIHRTYARLPHGRAELYQDFADCYLDTLIVQKGLNSPFTPLEKREVLNRLGWEMHKAMTGKTSALTFPPTRTGVETLVAEVLRAAGSADSESIARTLVDHVSQSSGLFIPSGTDHGEEIFAFAHLSFQEFFAASRVNSALAEQGWGEQEDELLTREGVVELANDPQWGQGFIFLFEMVRPKIGDWLAERILRYLDRLSSAAMMAQVVIDVHSQISPEFRRKAVRPLLDPNRNNFADILAILMQGDEIRDAVTEHLAHLTSLSSLDLSYAALRNIAPLTALKSLQSLNLWGTEVTNVAPLAELTSLRVLTLSSNGVIDIAPLAALKSLHSLVLSYTGMSDMAPLAALTSLESLFWAGPGGTDIAPLAALKSLQRLDLWCRGVIDIAPLAALKSLQSLTFHYTHVTDIAPLAELTSLQSLSLNGTAVTDIAPLAKLTSLEILSLNDTAVTDIAPLAKLTSLQSLSLNATAVTDITPLAELKSLEDLDLDRTAVTDIAPLAELTSLQSLSLNGTAVTDIAPLAKLTSLEILSLNGTAVTDIAPLAKLTSLQRLSLNGTAVTDIAPLAKLTTLQSLDLRNTRVTDLAPLAVTENLTIRQ